MICHTNWRAAQCFLGVQWVVRINIILVKTTRRTTVTVY